MGKRQPEVTDAALFCSLKLHHAGGNAEITEITEKNIQAVSYIFFGSITPFFSLTLKCAPVNTQALASNVQNLAPKGISCPHFVQ